MDKIATPLTAKKSYKDGHVAVAIKLKCRGWHSGSDSARIEASTELTIAQTRALAANLIEYADMADAKVAKKAKHEENRSKWKEREIAAGRMIVMKGFR